MDWTELEPKPQSGHRLGDDLSKLSIGELQELAERLRAEIVRVEEAMGAKQSSKNQAEAVFKR